MRQINQNELSSISGGSSLAAFAVTAGIILGLAVIVNAAAATSPYYYEYEIIEYDIVHL